MVLCVLLCGDTIMGRIVESQGIIVLRESSVSLALLIEHAVNEIGENIKKKLEICIMETADIIEYQEEYEDYREPYTIDLNRPFITDQVLDRKPRHLVKKIIR